MHLLPVSLLAILAGTLLLAKTRKEELGKFFAFISWFFIVVGFILFIGHICKVTNGYKHGHGCCSQEMMMGSCPHQMHPGIHPGMHPGMCCPPEMQKGCCEKKENCEKKDSTAKSCPKQPAECGSKQPPAK